MRILVACPASRHPSHLLMIKPEPKIQTLIPHVEEGARNGTNETQIERRKNPSNSCKTNTSSCLWLTIFQVLNVAYLERRLSLLCALRISAPAHTISGPKQRITVPPAFKPRQQKKSDAIRRKKTIYDRLVFLCAMGGCIPLQSNAVKGKVGTLNYICN